VPGQGIGPEQEQAMATNFGKVFGSIGAAQVTKRGDYVKEGSYLFEVAEVKLFEGNDNVPVHVAELIVREATKTGEGEPSAVGSTVSVVNKLGGATAKVAPGKIKAFTLALFDLADDFDPNKVAQLVEETCDESTNPCKGRLIRGATYHFTSKGGTSGLGLNFSPVPNQTKKDIAARAAAQG
jgi:hypothetical protein